MKLPLTRALLTTVMVCLTLPNLLAQRYSFKRYDQDSGLPDQSIQTLLQDRTGFLWIASDNGLHRYDGHRFRSYTKDDGLPASQVEALYQTPDGTIWAATIPGLARLKGERFELVDICGKRGAGALAADSSGRLYVGTWSGLVALSSPSSSKPAAHVYQLPSGEVRPVRSVAVSPSGAVWFTCGRQLCRLEGEKVVSRTEWAVPGDMWQAIQIDPRGSVWARSRTRLIELPAGESRFRSRDRDLPPSATRGTLLVDRNGRLWVPTLRGLARLTPRGWDVIGKARGLPMSSVQCAYQDREGSIWIGLNGGGLVRWLGYPYWESWTETEGLSSESVWQMLRGRDGILWTASDSGISRFDEARRRWEDLKVPGLPQGQTPALGQAADGSLWAGQVGGAVHVDVRRGWSAAYGREAGLQNPWISSVVVDAQSRVWLGTPNGLYRSNSHGSQTVFERQNLSLEVGADFHNEILLDRQGRVWVGGWGGILRWEGGRWTRFTTAEGLLQNRVAHLGEGKDGSIWLSYSEALGVSRLVAESPHPRWRHYDRKDGLRSLKVYFLGSDIRGWMWIGTDQGVDVYDGASWRHLDHNDGLAWDDCNGKSFWSDSDGSVWIGTARGISHVRIPPGGLPPRPSDAPVLMTSALIGGRTVVPDGPITVPWSQRSLHVGYAAMTFFNEDTLQFRYRIAGLDHNWTETLLREAHLPSLPAGDHIFEVQAKTAQGDWTSAPARLSFTIRPAWWRTLWAELGAAFTAGWIARRTWKWRLRHILRRQKELEDAVSERTRYLERQKQEIELLLVESKQAARLKDEFLANMSHEIRTPMNGIIGMTGLALETELSAEQREYLDVVSHSSASLLGIIDDILDFSKIEAGKIDLQCVAFDVCELVNAAARNLAGRARPKGLEVFCRVDPDVPQQVAGDPYRVSQVLVNLLGNAVKFTERGTVSVHLSVEELTEKPLLHFEVADTGIGIAREKLAEIFEPFSQADGSLTRRHGGTGLGLTLCSRFVEMMGGRIWVESEPGSGSRFHFTVRFQRPPQPL